MIGELLAGHYKVLQALGAGGFGHTYIVEDTHRPSNPKCVLKHLRPASDDPQVLETARKLFHKEAETLEKLGEYPQIPRLLAYFEEDQEFYLAQEFIEGQPLSKELPPGKKWTENQVIELLGEVVEILVFIHSQSVIHRDIKPDNLIRRNADGKLVLIDFGAIKQVRDQAAMELGPMSISVTVGTPGYMSTEQGRGTPRPSSDIYSLGMIGIQALTGVHPYKLQEDSETGEILWRHLVQVSAGLADVLTKMVRYHFKDRYQKATDALQAIKNLADPYNMVTIPATMTNTEINPETASINSATLAIGSKKTSVHELTLEWSEIGQVRTKKIREHQPSKNPGTFRIGRNPNYCDLVLADPTVSGLHVEVFFHPQQNCFYLRNLRESNPPVVDGEALPVGEVLLQQDSHFHLGQIELRIAEIALKDLTTIQEQEAAEAAQQESGLNETIITTQKPKRGEEQDQTIKEKTIAVSPSSQSDPSSSTSTPDTSLGHPKQKAIPIWIACLLPVAVLAGAAFIPRFITYSNITNQSNSNPQVSPQVSPSSSALPQATQKVNPQKCGIITPTTGGNIARIFSGPSRNTDTGKKISRGTKVAWLQIQDAFVKIQLSDGSQGWVFNDQIKSCS